MRSPSEEGAKGLWVMGKCFPSADMVTLGGQVKVKAQVEPKYFFFNFFLNWPLQCAYQV